MFWHEGLAIVKLSPGFHPVRRELLREATERWGPLKPATPGVRLALDAVQQFSRDLLVIGCRGVFLGALSYRRDYCDPGLLKVTEIGVTLRNLGLGTALMQALFRVASGLQCGVTLYPIDDAARTFFSIWGMHERWEGEAVHLDLFADEVSALAAEGLTVPLSDVPPLSDEVGLGTGCGFR